MYSTDDRLADLYHFQGAVEWELSRVGRTDPETILKGIQESMDRLLADSGQSPLQFLSNTSDRSNTQ